MPTQTFAEWKADFDARQQGEERSFLVVVFPPRPKTDPNTFSVSTSNSGPRVSVITATTEAAAVLEANPPAGSRVRVVSDDFVNEFNIPEKPKPELIR